MKPVGKEFLLSQAISGVEGCSSTESTTPSVKVEINDEESTRARRYNPLLYAISA